MRKKIIIGLCIIMLLLFATQAFALGITPARNTIKYGQDELKGKIRIINTEGEALTLHIKTEGNLNIDVPKTYEIPAGVSEGVIEYNFSIDSIKKDVDPGMTKGKIIISPVKINEEGETAVSLQVNLVHQVWVDIPYPDEFIEKEIRVQTNPSIIELGLINKGKELPKLEATMILNKDGEDLAEWKKNFGIVPTGKEINMKAIYPEQLPIGFYEVGVTLEHEKTEKFSETFLIGDKIMITNINYEAFKLGEIAPITISTLNIWKSSLEVYAEVIIKTDYGKIVSQFSTPVTILAPQEKGDIKGYWETKGISPGVYTMMVTLNYDGEQSVQELQLTINSQGLEVEQPRMLTTKQNNASANNNSTNWTIILISILLLMVIINGVLIYFFTIRKK